MIKKYAKKFTSLLLALALCLSLGAPALATENTEETSSLLTGDIHKEESGNLALFSMHTDELSIAIIGYKEEHRIDVSITDLLSTSDEVRQWIILDYPGEIDGSSDAFWADVIAYANARPEDADIITFTTTTAECEAAEMSISCDGSLQGELTTASPRGAVALSLTTQMAASLGAATASGSLGTWQYAMTDSSGVRVEIYEHVSYSITKSTSKSWKNEVALSVATLISKFLLANTDGVVYAICKLFSLVVNAASLLPASGEIQFYDCYAIYNRRGFIENRQYSTAIKYAIYSGMDNEATDYLGDAQFVEDDVRYEYSPSESYYNSLYLQATDAFDLYYG